MARVVIVGGGVIGLSVAYKLSLLLQKASEKVIGAIGGGLKPLSSIILLEKDNAFGSGNTSRNSQVIHSGLYYEKDSNKFRYCRLGNPRLYDFARKYHVNVRKCGKWLIARTEKEAEQLSRIMARNREERESSWNHAKQGLLPTFERISKASAGTLEPLLRSENILEIVNVPSTGVISTCQLVDRLVGLAESNDCIICKNHLVSSISYDNNKQEFEINVESKGHEAFSVFADIVINCSGLHADTLVKGVSKSLSQATRQQWILGRYAKLNLAIAKGDFDCNNEAFIMKPFDRLIYPISVNEDEKSGNRYQGLGVHSVVSVEEFHHHQKHCLFGPDAKFIIPRPKLDFRDPTFNPTEYENEQEMIESFVHSISTYVRLPVKVIRQSMSIDYCGVRARIDYSKKDDSKKDSEKIDDFKKDYSKKVAEKIDYFKKDDSKKVATNSDFYIDWVSKDIPFLHLAGIESPGLTSSLAIADKVCQMVHLRYNNKDRFFQ